MGFPLVRAGQKDRVVVSGSRYDVVIAGGGLAGLAAGILLARQQFSVLLVEKNSYPFHRVCGEYISEESRPFLEQLGLLFPADEYPQLRRLRLTAPDGFILDTDLRPGGFGISRYRLDAWLATRAKANGVVLLEQQKVNDIQYHDGSFLVQTGQQEVEAKLVLGCFGKRSNLDVKWKRPFVMDKSGRLNNHVAVKYHVRGDLPKDQIALHNFAGGYCGISAVEDDRYCLCYLTSASNLGMSNNNIQQMEATILSRNPHLRRLWSTVDFLGTTPTSISQVSFAPKSTIENHVLLLGDAAGLITPLCGNGMSMAFHSARLAVAAAIPFLEGKTARAVMEQQYRRQWQKQFARRLQAGRAIQSFFGQPSLTNILLRAGKWSPALTRFLIKQTHGENF